MQTTLITNLGLNQYYTETRRKKANKERFLLIDSGASTNILRNEDHLHDKTSDAGCLLEDAQGKQMKVLSKGTLQIQFLNSRPFKVDALSSPAAKTNLLSVGELLREGFYVNYRNKTIENKHGVPVAKMIQKGPYFWLSSKYLIKPQKTVIQKANNVNKVKYSVDYLHRLFGHVNVKSIKDSIKDRSIAGIEVDEVDWTNLEKFQCEICMMGKSTKGRHLMNSRLKYQKEYKPFQFIHTDLFGPVQVTAVNVPRYLLAFTDECTRYKWVFPLREKDSQSITARFSELVRFIETQLETKVLCFQMDQGTEFTNKTITQFFHDNGIITRFTTVGDSRSNGVAERTNLLLLNDCRTLLTSVKLPDDLWFYAVKFATLMRNSIVTTSTKESPRAKAGLTGLDISTVLPFGQPVIVNKPKTSSKLHSRGWKGYALCPSSVSFGYLIYVPGAPQDIIDTRHYRAIRDGVEPKETIIDSVIDHAEERNVNDRSDHDIPKEPSPLPNLNFDPTMIPSQNEKLGGTNIQVFTKPKPTFNMDPSLLKIIQSGGTTGARAGSTLPQGDESEQNKVSDPLPTASDQPDPTEKSHSGGTSALKLPPLMITKKKVSNVPILKPPVKQMVSTPPKLITIATDDENSVEEQNQSEPTSESEWYPSDPVSGGTNNSEEDESSSSEESSPADAPANNMKRKRNDSGEIEDQDGTTSQGSPPSSKQRIHYAQVTKNHSETHAERPSLSYKEAITYNSNAEEKEKFIAAYEKEIGQLLKMQTWDSDRVVNARDIRKNRIINSMFIFTTKRDGTKKCRFVARGDQQKPETYLENLQANTVHNYALMTCMAIALDNDMFITQLDISSAYLYAELKEELYIRAPPHLQLKDKVLRLNKSLYGLKQSGANWYQTIREFLVKQTQVKEADGWPCVFIASGIIVCLFVDDMVVFTNTIEKSQEFVRKLRTQYDTKLVNSGIPDSDGIVKYDILGLEVEYKKNEHLKFGMENSLTDKLPQLGIPLTDNTRFNKAPGQPGMFILKEDFEMEKEEYDKNVLWMQKVIGLASYVAQKYRYDILYYVNVLAQHTLYPTKQVKQLTHQLVQFLWNTREKRLVWHKQKNCKNNVLSAITDASFAGQPDFKSQGGFLVELNGKYIGGKSSKIQLTCTSSTEAEIYGITNAVPILRDLEELVWTVTEAKPSVKIITDSQPTIHLMVGDDDKKFRGKYFGCRARRLKDEVMTKGIKIEYISTSENVADLLTKPLHVKQFLALQSKFIQ